MGFLAQDLCLFVTSFSPFLWPNQNNQGVERGANGIMKVEISRTFEWVPLNLICVLTVRRWQVGIFTNVIESQYKASFHPLKEKTKQIRPVFSPFIFGNLFIRFAIGKSFWNQTLGNIILEVFGFPDYFLGGSQNWRIWGGGVMREYYVLCGADSFLSITAFHFVNVLNLFKRFAGNNARG